MSVVTNVILTAFLNEEAALAWISGQLDKGSALVRLASDNSPMAGTKTLEATVCVGAYNYLSLARLLELVDAAPWDQPEHVRVFVCEQDDMSFCCVYPPSLAISKDEE